MIRNPSFSLQRRHSDESTGNMNCHIAKCGGANIPENQKITAFIQGPTYSKAELRYLLTMWTSQCHRPFSIIEDSPLQEILRMLYAKVEIPSAKTLSKDVYDVFVMAQNNVILHL